MYSTISIISPPKTLSSTCIHPVCTNLIAGAWKNIAPLSILSLSKTGKVLYYAGHIKCKRLTVLLIFTEEAVHPDAFGSLPVQYH